MADVFLSYARADRDMVAPIVRYLQSLGWTVWWDPTIMPGERWDNTIRAELEQATCVVVVWTTAAVKSHWVKDEAAFARDRGNLVPVALSAVEIPLGFRQFQSVTLSGAEGSLDTDQVHLLKAGIERVIGRKSARRGHAITALATELKPALDAVRIQRSRLRSWRIKLLESISFAVSAVHRYQWHLIFAAAITALATASYLEKTCWTCKSHSIEITGSGFVPARLGVCNGDAYSFVNKSPVTVEVARVEPAQVVSNPRTGLPVTVPEHPSLMDRIVVNANQASSPRKIRFDFQLRFLPKPNQEFVLVGTSHKFQFLKTDC